MRYLSKAYYRKRCEEKEEEISEYRKTVNKQDAVIRFLLEESNSYRIKITPGGYIWNSGYDNNTTRLEYVDGNGVYHSHVRKCSPSKLEVLSSDKNSAILKLETLPKKYTYWILDKSSELVTEFSQDTLVKICDAEVASLITAELERRVNNGKA